MKAYVLEQTGGPEMLALQDVLSLAPKADEVKIRVRAFGLNRAEVYLRSGKMGPITSPRVPGIEAVGEIMEDPAGLFRCGQRVATAMGGMQFSRNGSYAEEVTVLRSNVVDLSNTSLPWEKLAALPESYLTVWGAIGKLVEGGAAQTLLVRGATSSVGLAAVTYAKAHGLKVVATTRSEENTARLREVGADVVVVDDGAISDVVRQILPDGVDFALEVVGVATVRDTLKTLRPFGHAVVIGLLGGTPMLDQFNLMQDLPAATRLSFFPSGMLGTAALPLSNTPLEWIASQIEKGQLPSLHVETFDFDEVHHAHSLLDSYRALGKLVVVL